jgi:transposase
MLIKEDNPLPELEALELALALDKAQTTIKCLKAEKAALEEENALLKEQLRLLQKNKFGKSTEQSKETNKMPETISVSGYTRRQRNHKPRGKNTDLSHLPHFQILHDLADDKKQCACCNRPLALIGKDSAKKLEVLPQRLYVAEHLSFKYACRNCDTLVEAKKKPSAIPKGLGGDSLIVEILENKYHYHLPLYRQSLMLEGYGAAVSDITLGNWVSHVGESLLSLYDAAWQVLLSSTYLQVDETPIKILKPDKQGYLWTYFSPLIGKGFVLFEASLTRSGDVAKQRLASFNGLLQTDGYNGYQTLRKRCGIVPLGCLTHARRKFKEVAHRGSSLAFC